jgi:hypothetical protein
MAVLTIEKREEYVGYAEYCVKLARQTDDWETRVILREMAAEWLKIGGCGRPLIMVVHLHLISSNLVARGAFVDSSLPATHTDRLAAPRFND